MTGSGTSLLLGLLAMLIPLGISLVVSSSYVYRPPAVELQSAKNMELLERGAQLYASRCVGCHGRLEKALSPAVMRTLRGPTLHQIVSTAAKRNSRLSPEEYLLESILQPKKFLAPGYPADMPETIAAGLDEEHVRALIYYLMNASEDTDEARIKALKIEPLPNTAASEVAVNRSQVERGRILYEQKAACIRCHPFRPDAGIDLVAPSLAGVGLLKEDELRDAVFSPSKKLTKGYRAATVSMPDGTIVQGRVMEQSADHLLLLVQNEDGLIPTKISLLADEDGEQPEVNISEVSLMPDNYAKLLSPDEQEELLAFLRTMKSLF